MSMQTPAGGTQSLLLRKVVMTTKIEDGVAVPGQWSWWGCSLQEAQAIRAICLREQQGRTGCSTELQVPRLACPCSWPYKMTGRWMGKLHTTTESGNDFKTVSKPDASSQFSYATEENCTSFPGNADADFLLKLYFGCSQWLGVPAATGDPNGTRSQVGSHFAHPSMRTMCQKQIKSHIRDLGSPGSNLCPSLILFSINLLSH